MKKMTSRIMVFAASAMLCSTVAWGQNQLKATIPFPFHTATGVVPAGDYSVEIRSLQGISSMVLLRNVGTRESFLTMGRAEPYVSSERKPTIDFVCAAASCSLRNIWTGSNNVVYGVTKPTASQRKESVPLATMHGD